MKFFTVKELQEILGIGRDKAYDLMRNKAFPSIKIGNEYRVEEGALIKWANRYESKEFRL